MNYRHAYHAGNFADVHKHVALVSILLHLRRKETPFAVIETHAGRGIYNLCAEEAQRTGEAERGITLLRGRAPQDPALAKYLEVVSSFDAQHYPGSPRISAQLLRPQDRLIAIEKHPEECRALRNALSPFPNARAISGDGYTQLSRLLPPSERRGVVLIDPPYEEDKELEQMARLLADAFRRFANGVYLMWLPLKDGSSAGALAGEIRNIGATKLLLLSIDVGRAIDDDPPGKLSAAGLLIINPPYSLDAEMRAASAELLPLLRRGPKANFGVEWLARP
jgi:23S rRNA (adenine2030-N6)-methyltransferase